RAPGRGGGVQATDRRTGPDHRRHRPALGWDISDPAGPDERAASDVGTIPGRDEAGDRAGTAGGEKDQGADDRRAEEAEAVMSRDLPTDARKSTNVGQAGPSQ